MNTKRASFYFMLFLSTVSVIYLVSIYKEKFHQEYSARQAGLDATEILRERREKIWIETLESQRSKPRKKRLPNAIGIGMEKCGTGAMAHFLQMHPMIKIPPGRIESHYFSWKYNKGPDFYMNLMPNATEDEIVMEKTPSYFNFAKDVAERMKELLPDVKLLLVLCDPVNRVYSDFAHEKIMGSIAKNSSLDDLLDQYLKKFKIDTLKKMDPEEAYLRMITTMQNLFKYHIFTAGHYYYFLVHWASVFKKEQIHVIDGEKLISDPGSEIDKLQDFLGIPRLLLPNDFVRRNGTGFFCFQPTFSGESRNLFQNKKIIGCLDASGRAKGRTRNKQTNLSDKTTNRLRELYRESNEKLYEFLGKNFGWQ